MKRLHQFLICALLLAGMPASAGAQLSRMRDIHCNKNLLVVMKDRVITTLPESYCLATAPTPPVPGWYAWRLSVDGPSGTWTVVVGPDHIVATNDVKRIVRGSTVRRCPDVPANASAPSITTCTVRISGSLIRTTDELGLEITDTAVVARLWREKPVSAWRTIIEPGGRFRYDAVAFSFLNEVPGGPRR